MARSAYVTTAASPSSRGVALMSNVAVQSVESEEERLLELVAGLPQQLG